MNKKRIVFLLPPYSGLPTRSVRCMQFKNDFRGGYQFVAYDLASKFRSRYKLYDKFLRYTWGVFILVKLVLISRQVWRVVLIKNTNITLQKIIYFFFKGRCALDINDPIHLQFDNKHTQELFLNTDLLILENQSLLNCYESLNPNIVVNEDYPYTEDLQVGSSVRENIILWYGSKETVFHLEKITSIIQKVLDNSEYRMVLLGVNKLPKGLKNKVSILENYDYKILKSNLKKCKIVLNISYYKDALLECYRINEVQSCDKLVISFYPNQNDISNFEYYKESMVFVNSIELMIENILHYLENEEEYIKKISKIKFNEDTNFIHNLL